MGLFVFLTWEYFSKMGLCFLKIRGFFKKMGVFFKNAGFGVFLKMGVFFKNGVCFFEIFSCFRKWVCCSKMRGLFF